MGPAKWIARDQQVEIAGLAIPGGMIYVGHSGRHGVAAPCVIDPGKPVAKFGDFTKRQTDYWPSYSDIAPAARRSYLEWLADGRRHPEADLGFVFLFFYGLERRAILDGATDETARADRADIANEVCRLLDVYGARSNSFLRYAGEFLDWLSVAGKPEKIYLHPLPDFSKRFTLPVYVRLALGQAAMDSVPVHPALALAWMKFEPAFKWRTSAKRCGPLFERLLVDRYQAETGPGIVLPRNRTKLKYAYRSASPGFLRRGESDLDFGQIPDVSVLSAPIKKLQAIIDGAARELEPYSRFVGKNPDAQASLEGVLLLPPALLPDRFKEAIAGLKESLGNRTVTKTYGELLATFDARSALSKERTTRLFALLESGGVGIEPDVIGGEKPPKPEDRIVLFTVGSEKAISRSTPVFHAARLTLQLASAVAAADGAFSMEEVNHLSACVKSWSHLPPNHLRRLLAHLRWLISNPVSLSGMKKKIDPLPHTAREALASFMVTVAQSDGTVSPDEIKILEKVYKVLGVDPKQVFQRVHAVASGAGAPSERTAGKATGFRLDSKRIAELQRDTEIVSALLTGIFQEQETIVTETPAPTDLPPPEGIEESAEACDVLGLDEAHGEFARVLMSRREWMRADLAEIAADRDLMLDGALERINEACMDQFEMPLAEGEDTLEINAEVLERMNA